MYVEQLSYANMQWDLVPAHPSHATHWSFFGGEGTSVVDGPTIQDEYGTLLDCLSPHHCHMLNVAGLLIVMQQEGHGTAGRTFKLR